jgi:hypothetical protein
MKFTARAGWIWADCFDGAPLPAEWLRALHNQFKICLVSPELHGLGERLREFTHLTPWIDAVCTKHPETWEKALS